MDGTQVIVAMICTCLAVMVLLLLSKPLKFLCKVILSAVVGSILIFLLQKAGFPIGINYITVLCAAILGIPGVIGLLLLCILL